MIDYLFDVLQILLLFAAFGAVHSLLASNNFKKLLIQKFGDLIAFYRSIFNFISLLLLYLVYFIAPHPDIIIFDLSKPFDLIILIPQFLSVVGIIWTLRYFSAGEFLGINQILRWYKGEYKIDEIDEVLTLRIYGPYKFSRHPLYFFSILFLIFRPEMNLFYLTSLICFIGYFYIGSFYEEKKLVERFGNKYLIYQKAVPRIFPTLTYKGFNSEKLNG